MRKIRGLFKDRKGEGYIDVAVMVFCVMLVIALGVRLFPIYITKLQIDNFADELVREAEIAAELEVRHQTDREHWRRRQVCIPMYHGPAVAIFS